MTTERSAARGAIARGAIAWMARNHVAANLLMVAFIVGGLVMISQIQQEVFPELELDFLLVTVPYPGASPEEVEEGIVLAVEEEVRGLDDVEEVTSVIREGVGIVWVELQLGTDVNKALADVKNAVDSIRTFPQDIERPTVSLAENERHVISVILHGDQSEAALRKLAEDVRERLLKRDEITQIELAGVRRPEIAVEISQENLRRYGLTLDQVAAVIRRSALDLPGGRVKAAGGEILVRTKERRYTGAEYAELAIITRNDGTTVKLEEIATILDDFEESDVAAHFISSSVPLRGNSSSLASLRENGERAVRLDVFRVGEQTPSEVSAAVRETVEELNAELPPTVRAAIWEDTSEVLDDRIRLLVKNARLGLILVLILLGLSLDVRLAFWVTLGIPTSICGGLLFFPAADLSINLVSMFAIIITIGIVVDDAVIVGENIFHMRTKGMSFLDAGIAGARQMAVPVTFSILTNIAAFVPLLFVPGVTGKIFKVIPMAVIMIFLVSLIEALFILPAHLSARERGQEWRWIEALNRRREWFGNFLLWLRDHPFRRLLETALAWRYATLAVAFGLLVVCFGLLASGRINVSFIPRVEGERITAAVSMPYGTPIEETRKVQQRLLHGAREVLDAHGGEAILRGIYTQVGAPPANESMVNIGEAGTGAHLTNVSVYLVPIDRRQITAENFATRWHRGVGELPGVESLTFRYTTGPSSNIPVNLRVSHPDTDTLERAASDLAEVLEGYAGVRDINDGYSSGKVQLDFTIKDSARGLGLTASDLARQVRGAFYGAEALRVQRGRDEVKVLVRLPRAERRSPFNIEELMVRTPSGAEIPIREAADIIRGTSYTEILRADGRRVLSVTADVEAGVANANKVVASVREKEYPRLLEAYPGLKFELDGEQEDQMEAMSSLGFGFLYALFAIYALLAIPFKSYAQPVIIMVCIPFGMIGAFAGHLLMGYELSIMSMFGIVALSGVVVNDSLILVHTANHNRWAGQPHFDSIFGASLRRFRPIVLTSLTTFLGLAPMIFETSIQARFLIPMAISLGFGILFATMIALVIIPCLYLALADVGRLFGFVPPEGGQRKASEEVAADPALAASR
ncbi:MAG: efflux RND transporter permease subunit [bacterium]|nr:efflux RND transporter permease subunit [bacterium]